MSASVRLFSHSTLVALPIDYAGQRSENASFVLRQPYLAGQAISANTSTAQTSSAALASDAGTKILRVEVQQGKVVHYEVTPSGYDARTATTSSPTLKGRDQIQFGPGWAVSLLEGDIAA